MNTFDGNDLEARIARLERSTRRWKNGAAERSAAPERHQYTAWDRP
jgi:hypothetical protein